MPKRQQKGKTTVTPNSPIALDGYDKFIEELKSKVQRAQLKAAVAVNSELMNLYWDLGRSIVDRQEGSGWGDAVLDKLSHDLMVAFPDLKGFSRRNLYRIRAWYLAYREESKSVPQAVAQIPWGHNTVILEKVKDPEERRWYAAQTKQNGWSRAVLIHQIESKLFHRLGNAIANFDRVLPATQSDLARQVLKDPYNFDFLTLDAEAHERDLERGLLEHMKSFLLELGVGFAFVGSQFHLEVGGEDFYMDLLFYHLNLRCFVVLDLKVVEFKPEFAGKMNFYLSAVDDLLRHKDDSPSIGIILCKTKNKVVAEYALRDSNKPIGVAEYRITESIPASYQGNLPTIEELEGELSAIELSTDATDLP